MKPICIFGDSIGKGVVLDAIRGRYILLKNSFINLFSLQTGIEVENFSKFGCTITTGKKIIEQKLDKLNSYAYTVLGSYFRKPGRKSSSQNRALEI